MKNIPYDLQNKVARTGKDFRHNLLEFSAGFHAAQKFSSNVFEDDVTIFVISREHL